MNGLVFRRSYFERGVVPILMLAAFSGCATGRQKTITAMIATGAVSGVVGAMTAPESESSLAHGALWGGVGAATAGIIGHFIFNDDPKIRDLEHKNVSIERELKDYRDQVDPKLEGSFADQIKQDLPEDLQPLVKGGRFKVYKMSRWLPEGENRLIHQDQVLEIVPPQLNPSGLARKQSATAKDDAQNSVSNLNNERNKQ